MLYTPDKEFNKNSSNGFYKDERYAKSYTHSAMLSFSTKMLSTKYHEGDNIVIGCSNF
jgi:hypothetical protein